MPVDGTTDDRFGEFCGWLTRSQPDLRRLAVRLTSSATDAADLAQATSLRALEKRALFVTGSFNELKKWLTRIMFNLHYERVRGSVREVLADWLDDVAAASEPPPPLWLMVADEEVSAAVAQLNPALRVAYVLYTVDGCSYANISSRLRIPMQTVATKVHRARARLRQTLTAGRAGNVPGWHARQSAPGRTPVERTPRLARPQYPQYPQQNDAARSLWRRRGLSGVPSSSAARAPSRTPGSRCSPPGPSASPRWRRRRRAASHRSCRSPSRRRRRARRTKRRADLRSSRTEGAACR